MKPKAIAYILAAYSREDTVKAIRSSDAIAEILQINTKLIVLNSESLKQEPPSLLDNWTIIYGSNSNHEFSAWQEGLDFIQKARSHVDIFIFANDTIGRNQSEARNIDKLSFACRIINQSKDEAVGFVGKFEKGADINILGFHAKERLCTCLFSVSGSVMRKLDYKIDYQDVLHELLQPVFSRDQVASESCESGLRRHIEDWLLNGGWHSSGSRPLSESEFYRLRSKCLCILNEIYFSALAVHRRATLVHLTKFSSTSLFSVLCKGACSLTHIRNQAISRIPQGYGFRRITRVLIKM